MGSVQFFLRNVADSVSAAAGRVAAPLLPFLKRISSLTDSSTLAWRSINWIKESPLRLTVLVGILAISYLFYRKRASNFPEANQVEGGHPPASSRSASTTLKDSSTLPQDAAFVAERNRAASPYQQGLAKLLETAAYKKFAKQVQIDPSASPSLQDLQLVLIEMMRNYEERDALSFLRLFILEHRESDVLNGDFLSSYWMRFKYDLWEKDDEAREAHSSLVILRYRLIGSYCLSSEMKPIRDCLKVDVDYFGFKKELFDRIKISPYQVSAILISFLSEPQESLFKTLLLLEVDLKGLYQKQPKLAKEILFRLIGDILEDKERWTQQLMVPTQESSSIKNRQYWLDFIQTLAGRGDLSKECVTKYLQVVKPAIWERLKSINYRSEGAIEQAISSLKEFRNSSDDAVVRLAINIHLCSQMAALMQSDKEFVTAFFSDNPVSELLQLKEEFWDKKEGNLALLYGLLREDSAYTFLGLKYGDSYLDEVWFKDALFAYLKGRCTTSTREIGQMEGVFLLRGMTNLVAKMAGKDNEAERIRQGFEIAVQLGLKSGFTFADIARRCEPFEDGAIGAIGDIATLIADMREEYDYTRYDRAVSLLRSDVSQACSIFEGLQNSNWPYLKEAAKMQLTRIRGKGPNY